MDNERTIDTYRYFKYWREADLKPVIEAVGLRVVSIAVTMDDKWLHLIAEKGEQAMSRFVDEFHPEPTDIALCGSMAHKAQWLPIIDELRAAGYTVSTPDLSESVDWSGMSDEQAIIEKGRLVRRHFANIERAKVVLVANFEKNGTEGYVGTNTLLEMGTGFVLEKPIYLYNPVPQQHGREEILALEPIVIHGDISKIEVK